ncbi:MAG: 30S ribosomal protein S20 [Candidatus Gottesmanbacteria bacterium]
MPITLSAKKKVRQDKRRRNTNLSTIYKVQTALSSSRKTPSLQNIKSATSIIDKAVKKKIIHKNKAARLKARLVKKFNSQKPNRASKKTKVD